MGQVAVNYDGEEHELFISNVYSHTVAGELVALKFEAVFSSSKVLGELDTYKLMSELTKRAAEVLSEQSGK